MKFIWEAVGTTVVKVSVPLRGYGFEIVVQKDLTAPHSRVSVPLRGYGFEIMKIKNATPHQINIVSVPLRGYGFEMVNALVDMQSALAAVSVPLRGYGFEITDAKPNSSFLHSFRPLAGIWF